MKKLAIAGIIIGILVILGFAGFYFLNSESNEVFCQEYDDNQEQCLSYPECEWDSQQSNCEPIGGMEEREDEDFEGNSDENFGEEEKIFQELDAIVVPDNPSNEICKKLPLSGEPPYGRRYDCLALMNNDARFCEGLDEIDSKNICLARANEDSSYCKKIESEDAKHVCYYMLAVSSKNVNFCGDIDYNQNEKEQCYFSFMSNLYQWGKSDEITTEMCNQLGSPDDKTCLALKERDISMCEDNLNCLTFFEQPLSFCDNFSNKVSCMKDRAKFSKNISICELLSQPDRDVCVGVYCTHIKLDVNVCDKIEDVNIKEEFYVELAMNLNNGY